MAKEISKYTMFIPQSRRKLSSDYPELKDYPEISELNRGEQIFTYLLGCEASPLYEDYLDAEKKDAVMKKAAELSFRGPLMPTEIKEMIKKGRLNATYNKAVERWESFDLKPRIRSKKMLEKIINNLENIVDVDVNGVEFYELDKDGSPTKNVDWDKKKKYADMAINIAKNIDSIQRQAQGGFGIVDLEEDTDKITEEGQSLIDLIHEQN